MLRVLRDEGLRAEDDASLFANTGGCHSTAVPFITRSHQTSGVSGAFISSSSASHAGHQHSAFFGNPAIAAASGAVSGAMMYGTCKSKCPGATGDALDNIPGGRVVIKAMRMAIKAALTALANSAKVMVGGELKSMPNPMDLLRGDDQTEQEIELEEERRNSVDPKYLEFEAVEFSACRMNCKLKALLTAASTMMLTHSLSSKRSAGGSVGGMDMGPPAASAVPLDEWSTGPMLATLRDDEEQKTLSLPEAMKRRLDYASFLDHALQMPVEVPLYPATLKLRTFLSVGDGFDVSEFPNLVVQRSSCDERSDDEKCGQPRLDSL